MHSEYSLLDGACRVEELAERAAELGMPAVAVTDHGVMYGVVEFYKACRSAGVNPVIGCEIYVAPRTRFDREPKVDDDLHHLVLLAENQEGYRNLVRLVSLASLEGFYYKPRVDKDLLAAHSRGLIALTACLGGEVPKRLLRGDPEGARRAAGEYRDIFGRENFFLELQDHGIPEQQRVNPDLIVLARDLDLGLVATNDVHYLRREDAQAHDVLVCIQTGKTVHDRDRMKYPGGQFYMKSTEEMEAVFRAWPEALDNTVAIAERCRVDFEFGKVMLPEFKVPEGETAATWLRRLCEARLPERYPEASAAAAGGAGAASGDASGGAGGAVRERLEYELGVIERMGYPGYFLIVSDFIEHARSRGIAVGPGRGSAAGSLVAYVLGITGIDPLRYNLLFERFLNPERVSMPDMDIDFDDRRRGEVIDYVREKYGDDRVSQIITFGRMLARAVVRDVGRALGMPYGEVDRIAKMVPAALGMTLDKALELSPELKEAYEGRPEIKSLIDLARRLEGLPRHASVHAAGVVIARDPLMDHVPLQRMPDGTVVSQFPMNIMEELGLLKFDFLGLRTLSVIEEAARLASEAAGRPVDPYALSLDDGPTYELLGQGETAGVFQLESGGMRDTLKNLRPTCIEDIIAAVALYRPGPMENIPEFIRSKHEGGIKYLHPLLEPILKDTYGIMVYQEQIMQVASAMAGFSLGQADILRRAVGKKKKEVLGAQREVFVSGCVKQGHPKKLANELYDLIVKFANYGFNRCLPGDVRVIDYDSGEPIPLARLVAEGRRPGVLSLGPDGKLRRGQVTGVFTNGVKPVYRLKTASGRTIRASSTHRFLRFDGWAELGDLRPGDPIAVPRTLAAGSDILWDRVVAIEPDGEEETFDLTVEGDHNFVADDLIVHNSHAAAYGYLAYITAYLKANFPVPFMAALLTSVKDNTDKVAEYIRECRRAGIPVLPPDVNESRADFTVVGGRIRFGLAAVKNVGEGAVECIVQARERGGPFTSLMDFLTRVDLRTVNRRAVESLVKAGALDSLGARRSQLLEVLETAMQRAQAGGRRPAGQVSLFDAPAGGNGGPAIDVAPEMPLPDIEEFPHHRLLALEKEVLGLYISGHPLEGREEDLAARTSVTVAGLADLTEGVAVVVGGLVAAARTVLTRNGERMSFLALEDLTGQVEVVLFPRVLERSADLAREDGTVLVRGRVSWKDEQVTVVAEDLLPLDVPVTELAAPSQAAAAPAGRPARGPAGVPRGNGGGRPRARAAGSGAPRPQALFLRLPDPADAHLIQDVKDVLAAYPGKVPVLLRLPAQKKTIRIDPRFWVDPRPEVSGYLERLLGAGNVSWLNAIPGGAIHSL